MADQTYVEIAKFAVDSGVDGKWKGKAVDLMGKAASGAVKNSGKLTDNEPKDKKTKGWFLLGKLESIGPDKAGKKFEAVVSGVVSVWPAKAMKTKVTGKAAFPIASADEKVSPGDADGLITAATKEAMKSAIPYMEKTKPE